MSNDSKGSRFSAIEATLDEAPKLPDLGEPRERPPIDPNDPLEGATTRIPMPPKHMEEQSWAQEVPSQLEMVGQPPQPAPVQPEDGEEALAFARSSAESQLFDPLETQPQPEAKEEEPVEAGASTWKPTADRQITDYDLSERARLLREQNAETKDALDQDPAYRRARQERVLVESSPAGMLGQGIYLADLAPTLSPPSTSRPTAAQAPAPSASAASQPAPEAEEAPPPALAPPTPDEMMPEEATLAGSSPSISTSQPFPRMELPRPSSITEAVHEEESETVATDDPSMTMKGALAQPNTIDEFPTWAPEQQPVSLVPPQQHASFAPTAPQPMVATQPAIMGQPAVQPRPITSNAMAARRAPTKVDDAAIVEQALGSHQRYLITVAFAILGLLAGIAAALIS